MPHLDDCAVPRGAGAGEAEPFFRRRQMRRLKLNLEVLTVESFSTDEALRRRGTVYGREDTAEGDPSWPEGTCVETCAG